MPPHICGWFLHVHVVNRCTFCGDLCERRDKSLCPLLVNLRLPKCALATWKLETQTLNLIPEVRLIIKGRTRNEPVPLLHTAAQRLGNEFINKRQLMRSAGTGG